MMEFKKETEQESLAVDENRWLVKYEIDHNWCKTVSEMPILLSKKS